MVLLRGVLRPKSTLASHLYTPTPRMPAPWVLQRLPGRDSNEPQQLDLKTLTERLPRYLHNIEGRYSPSKIGLIKGLLSRVTLSEQDLSQYALSVPERLYTRNVIALAPGFSLLCLVWAPGVTGCIHDHPRAGCWVRVLSGAIEERLYRPLVDHGASGTGKPVLEEFKVTRCMPGDVTYIDDYVGYHRMSNPNPTETAISLHLYSPEYRSCTVWSDTHAAPEQRAIDYDTFPTGRV